MLEKILFFIIGALLSVVVYEQNFIEIKSSRSIKNIKYDWFGFQTSETLMYSWFKLKDSESTWLSIESQNHEKISILDIGKHMVGLTFDAADNKSNIIDISLTNGEHSTIYVSDFDEATHIYHLIRNATIDFNPLKNT